MSHMIDHVYGPKGDSAALRDLRIVLGYTDAPHRNDETNALLLEAKARLARLTAGDVIDVVLRMRTAGLSPLTPERSYHEPAREKKRL